MYAIETYSVTLVRIGKKLKKNLCNLELSYIFQHPLKV